MIEHKKWPKIPRAENVTVMVTEKIDGTNAVIFIENNVLVAGSRNRWLSADDDQFGFHAWCMEHYDELLKLGNGYHYGEWYGFKINRGYGLKDRRLALFNPRKGVEGIKVPGLTKVPILWEGNLHEFATDNRNNKYTDTKRTDESVLVPGFFPAEGFIININGQRFKTVMGDKTKKLIVNGVEFGKGKYEGKIGALITSEGNVGSGLTDKIREMSPADLIGSVIEVEHNGYTTGDKLKFPRFKKLHFHG